LPKEILDGIVSSAEDFQNRVLRPIVKMQSDVLLRHVSNKLRTMKVDWTRLTPPEQRNLLNGLFSKDAALKHEVIGMVIGQLSEAEYTEFSRHQKELKRRISQIVLNRSIDQLVNSRLR
jgi:hypothetical protein